MRLFTPGANAPTPLGNERNDLSRPSNPPEEQKIPSRLASFANGDQISDHAASDYMAINQPPPASANSKKRGRPSETPIDNFSMPSGSIPNTPASKRWKGNSPNPLTTEKMMNALLET